MVYFEFYVTDCDRPEKYSTDPTIVNCKLWGSFGEFDDCKLWGEFYIRIATDPRNTRQIRHCDRPEKYPADPAVSTNLTDPPKHSGENARQLQKREENPILITLVLGINTEESDPEE